MEQVALDGDLWFGLGDYIDAITTNDPRFNAYEIAEKYSVRDLDDLPKKQTDYFIESIVPIANKCGGLIYGNHEDTYRRYNNFDVVRYICGELDIPNLRHKAFISLSFEQNNKSIPVRIVMEHGTGGGGMREGYPINKVYDVFRYDIADVHVMGHLHQMQTDRCVYTSYQYNSIRSDPSWFCVAGCFLHKQILGNDSYMEQRAGKSSSIGLLKQTIYPSSSSKGEFDVNIEKIYI